MVWKKVHVNQLCVQSLVKQKDYVKLDIYYKKCTNPLLVVAGIILKRNKSDNYSFM